MILLCALELGELGKQNGREGKSQSDHQLRDQKIAELATI